MEKLEFKKDAAQRIGIDKLRLSGFRVSQIDLQKLLSIAENVEITASEDKARRYKRCLPGTDTGIAKILIKDNQKFSDLVIGCASGSNGMPVEYVYLNLSVANAKGCNLENMSFADYDRHINSVMKYISAAYGVILDASQMKADYMEINANIFLNEDFSKYNRALRLFMSFFNNHMGKLSTYSSYHKAKNGKKSRGESYKRGNKSTEIIFYDKTKQLFDNGIQIDGKRPVLRIELRLKTKQKIKSAFNSCYWKDLDNEKIAAYFHKQISEYLSGKFERWQQTRERDLLKMIPACRKKSPKLWHHILMQEIRNKSESQMIPYILDMEQIISAFRNLPDPHRNASRSIRSLLNTAVDDDIYKNNDLQKAREILDRLNGMI